MIINVARPLVSIQVLGECHGRWLGFGKICSSTRHRHGPMWGHPRIGAIILEQDPIGSVLVLFKASDLNTQQWRLGNLVLGYLSHTRLQVQPAHPSASTMSRQRKELCRYYDSSNIHGLVNAVASIDDTQLNVIESMLGSKNNPSHSVPTIEQTSSRSNRID